jgi:hypothetical protein
MRGATRRGLLSAAARVVAALLLCIGLVNAVIGPSTSALASACAGDEQILVAPAVPRVGGQLIVAAFSRVGHEQAILLGPAGPLTIERVAIGDRYVWQSMVTPEYAGQHVFAFSVATGTALLSTCADATVLVLEPETSPLVASLNPYGQTASAVVGQAVAVEPSDAPVQDVNAPPVDAEGPEGESTGHDGQTVPARRPTRTPTRHPDNENENGNDNQRASMKASTQTPTNTPTRSPTNTREPTRTPTPRPTSTPTAEPTPTLAPASISGISPSRAICGQQVAIRGDRFGNDRGEVDGKVYVDGRDASISDWDMTEIRVSVPLSVRAGNSRLLEVIVAGRTTTKEIAVTC